MPEVSVLLAIVCLLYLHDCSVWHGEGTYCFRGIPGRCDAKAGPVVRFGATGGISFVGAIPVGSIFLAQGTSLDAEGARRSVAAWRSVTLAPRVACTALLTVIVGGAFLLSWFAAWAAWWPIWAGAGLSLWMTCFGLIVIADARLSRSTLFSAAARSVVLLTSPLTTIRGVDRISANLLREYHPAIAACVLCAEGEFGRVVRTFLFPTPHDDREALLRSDIELLLKSVDRVATVTALPPPELGFPNYCPRCWTRYRHDADHCSDCDIRLMSDTARECVS